MQSNYQNDSWHLNDVLRGQIKSNWRAWCGIDVFSPTATKKTFGLCNLNIYLKRSYDNLKSLNTCFNFEISTWESLKKWSLQCSPYGELSNIL